VFIDSLAPFKARSLYSSNEGFKFNPKIGIEMKKIMILATLVFVANVGFSQKATDAKSDVAVVAWDSQTYDFGKIKQGVPVTHEFKFTNKGKVPAVITNAQPSCGCTTPNWTRDPVMTGGEGLVKATFNAMVLGPFDKVITVTANTEGGVILLHIKGEVEGTAVANTTKPN
jgi:hypothetical protein